METKQTSELVNRLRARGLLTPPSPDSELSDADIEKLLIDRFGHRGPEWADRMAERLAVVGVPSIDPATFARLGELIKDSPVVLVLDSLMPAPPKIEELLRFIPEPVEPLPDVERPWIALNTTTRRRKRARPGRKYGR